MREAPNYTKISKRLSFLLRHSTDPIYVDLNGGWANVSTVLQVLHTQFPEVNRAVLDEIVASDNKGRYSYDKFGKKIRANQGHSIPGVIVDMEEPEPPQFLYHGTATRFLDAIMKDGLKPMRRQYVHISPDYETAVNVGSRHGKPVVLVIKAKEFVADGHKLYRSTNGVWQAEAVPTKYFSIMFEEG